MFEKIAIWDESFSQTPGHMKVLEFVGVDD